MTRGAVVRDSRRAARRIDLAERRRREFRDVRHPLKPELHVERVLICPSGVHVVTSLLAEEDPSTDAVLASRVVTHSRAAADVVSALLPQRYRGRVRPVLCSTDNVAMAELVDGVLLTSPTTLEHIVRSSPVVLSTSEINEVALRLDARLEPFPIPAPKKPGRWNRRRAVLAGLAAAATATGVVLMEQVGVVRLPW
ncbi:MAG TPA: hypothetical protein VK204_03350 [Nocardioidaceae bacterium]|nr:hypothetical protein [Nocardioidaceae bacterium]